MARQDRLEPHVPAGRQVVHHFPALLGSARRWNMVLLAVFLLGAAWIWRSSVPASATIGGLVPAPREDFSAPDFTLPTLAGEQVTLSSLRGKVVVINLWTSWCPPCREEMPALEQAYRQYQDQGVVVLGLNSTIQDDEQEAAAFAGALELTFPILLDQSGSVSRRYQLQALPTTFFIDRQGIIRSITLGGPLSLETIEKKIDPLLAADS